MQVKLYLPNSILTWAKDQADVQIPITSGMYMEIKKVSTGVVIIKHFDAAGGYHGANNHPTDFEFMLDEGDYEVTLAAVHKTRMPVQIYYKRHDDSDSNSSSTSITYFELLAGQKVKFPITISAYNSGGTQWFKINTLMWFENRSTHQWSQKNPTPPAYPATSTTGELLEKQYYAQEICPVTVSTDFIAFQNPNVAVLPQNLGGGMVSSRFSLPNTPTIEILNPNNNGGNPQYVSNPLYQNVSNTPAAPAITSAISQALGTPIFGTVLDNTAIVAVFRNNVEITTINVTPTFGTNASWVYTPTTSEAYKFKARKGLFDSAFSEVVNVTNSCNLTNNQALATWNVNGNSFIAKTFDGGLTFHFLKVVQLSPLKFEKRGKNMLQRSDMTSLGAWRLADMYNCFVGIDTGAGGLEYDTTFTAPAGFAKVGNIFEQITAVKPAAPVPQATTGTVGVMNLGNCDQAGTVIVFRDNVQVATVVTSGVANLYGYNATQSGNYTFQNSNDNGFSDKSIVVIVRTANIVTTRKFRAEGIEYADISPENIEAGASTSTAAAVTVWNDGTVIETDLLLAPNLKGFIRDKTNHARVFGRLI